MSLLTDQIEKLERKSNILGNVADEIVAIREYIDDIEDTSATGVRTLIARLNTMIGKYEYLSSAVIAKIDADGFRDEKLTKYTGSTYKGELITGVRIDKDNTVFAITARCMHELGHDRERTMHGFSADSALLDFRDLQSEDDIVISK